VKRYLLLAASDDRRHLLEACIASIKDYLPGWTLVFSAQTFDPYEGYLEALCDGIPTKLFYFKERMGAHDAKLVGLEWIDQDAAGSPYVVANIDDDMQFMPETDFEPAATVCMEKGVGFVTCNWCQHEGFYEKRRKALKPEFIKQPIVYTAGGMLFDNEMADRVRAIGPGDFICDNSEWSLVSYLSGHINYRYRGSLCIHRVGRSGGRREWLGVAERRLPDERYLPFQAAGVGFNGKNKWRIGRSEDLTELAHETHRAARAKLMEEA
jgi:glycosyltransferase involved in cell wall biosynthesis